jgi:hypothetical protein
MTYFNKIIPGEMRQSFDEDGTFIGQEFVSDGPIYYTDDQGEIALPRELPLAVAQAYVDPNS